MAQDHNDDDSPTEEEKIETAQSLDDDRQRNIQKQDEKKKQKIRQDKKARKEDPSYVGRDKIQIWFHVANMTSKIGLGILDEVTDWSYYYYSNFQNQQLKSMILFFLVSSLGFEVLCWMIIFADINLKRVKNKEKSGYFDIDEKMRIESSDFKRFWFMAKYSLANLMITLIKSIQLVPASLLMTLLIEIKAASFLIHYFFTKVVGVVLTQDICDIVKISIKTELREERIQKLSKTSDSHGKVKGHNISSIEQQEKKKIGNGSPEINETEHQNAELNKITIHQNQLSMDEGNKNLIEQPKDNNSLQLSNRVIHLQRNSTVDGGHVSTPKQLSPESPDMESEQKNTPSNDVALADIKENENSDQEQNNQLKQTSNSNTQNEQQQQNHQQQQQQQQLQQQQQQQQLQQPKSKNSKNQEQVEEPSDTMAALDASMEKNFSTYLFKAEIGKLTRTADTVKVLTKAFPMAILQYLNNELLGVSWTALSIISFVTSLVTIVTYGVQIVSSLAQEQLEVMHYVIEKYRQTQSRFYDFFGVNIDEDSIKPQISTIAPFKLPPKITIKHDVETLTSLANCSSDNLKKIKRIKLDMSNCQSQKNNIQECLYRLNNIIEPGNTLVTLIKNKVGMDVPNKIYLFKEGLLYDFKQKMSVVDGKITLNPTGSVRKIIQNINVGIVKKFLQQNKDINKQAISSLEMNLDYINLKEKKFVFSEMVDYLIKMKKKSSLDTNHFTLILSFRKCQITYVEIDQLMNDLKRLYDEGGKPYLNLRLSIDLRDNDLKAREMQTLGRNLKQISFLQGLHLNIGNNSFDQNGFVLFCDEIGNTDDDVGSKNKMQNVPNILDSLKYLEIILSNDIQPQASSSNINNNSTTLQKLIESLKNLKGLKLIFKNIQEEQYIDESELFIALKEKITNLQYFIFSKNQILETDKNKQGQNRTEQNNNQDESESKYNMIMNFIQNAQRCYHFSYNQYIQQDFPFATLNSQSEKCKTTIINLKQLTYKNCLDILKQSDSNKKNEVVKDQSPAAAAVADQPSPEKNANSESAQINQAGANNKIGSQLLKHIVNLTLNIDIQRYNENESNEIINQIKFILNDNSNTLNEINLDITGRKDKKSSLKQLKIEKWDKIKVFDLKLDFNDPVEKNNEDQTADQKDTEEKGKEQRNDDGGNPDNNDGEGKEAAAGGKPLKEVADQKKKEQDQTEVEFNLEEMFNIQENQSQLTRFPLQKLTIEVSNLKIGSIFQSLLKKVQSLVYLKLIIKGNNLSLENLTQLQDLIAKQSQHLDFLQIDFEDSKIDKNGCYNLGKAIKKLYRLQSLNLNLAKNPNIKEKGAHYISESLKSLTKLQSLVLDLQQTNSQENQQNSINNANQEKQLQNLSQKNLQQIKYNKFYESISKLVELQELKLNLSQNKGLEIYDAVNFFEKLTDLKNLLKLNFYIDNDIYQQNSIENYVVYQATEKLDRAKILKSYKLLLKHLKEMKNLSQLEVKICNIDKKQVTTNNSEAQKGAQQFCYRGHSLILASQDNKKKDIRLNQQCNWKSCSKNKESSKIVQYCTRCIQYLCQECCEKLKKEKEKTEKQQMVKWIKLKEVVKKLFRSEEENFKHYEFAQIDQISIVQAAQISQNLSNNFMKNYEHRQKRANVNLSNKNSNKVSKQQQQLQSNQIANYSQDLEQQSFLAKCLPCISANSKTENHKNNKNLYQLTKFLRVLGSNESFSLNISYQFLTQLEFKYLCNQFSNLKNLNSFKIIMTNLQIGQQDKNQDLRNQSKIRPLSVQTREYQDSKSLSIEEINYLLNCLKRLSKLKKIDIKFDKNNLEIKPQDLSRSLEQFNELHTLNLNLSSAQMNKEAFHDIFEALNKMQELEHLSINFSMAKLNWENQSNFIAQIQAANELVPVVDGEEIPSNNQIVSTTIRVNFSSQLKSLKLNFSQTKLSLADINKITEQFKTLKNLQKLALNMIEMPHLTVNETELRQFTENIKEVIRSLSSFGISIAKNNFKQDQLEEISRLFVDLKDEYIRNKKELKINFGYQLESQQMPQQILDTIEQMKELNTLKLKVGETQLFKGEFKDQQGRNLSENHSAEALELESPHAKQQGEADQRGNCYTQLCHILKKKNLLKILVLDLSETMSEYHSTDRAGEGRVAMLFQAVAKIPQLLTLKLTLKNNLIRDQYIDSCDDFFTKIINLENLYLNLRSNDLNWQAAKKIITNLAFTQKNIKTLQLDFNSNNINLRDIETQLEIEDVLKASNIFQKLQDIKKLIIDLRDQREQDVLQDKPNDKKEDQKPTNQLRELQIKQPKSKDCLQRNIRKWTIMIENNTDDQKQQRYQIEYLLNKEKIYFDVRSIEEAQQEEQLNVFLKEIQKKKQLLALDLNLKAITVKSSYLLKLAEIFQSKLQKIQTIHLNLRKNEIENSHLTEFKKNINEHLQLKDFRINLSECKSINCDDISKFFNQLIDQQRHSLRILEIKIKNMEKKFNLNNLIADVNRVTYLKSFTLSLQDSKVSDIDQLSMHFQNKNLQNININLKRNSLSAKICQQILESIQKYVETSRAIKSVFVNLTENDVLVEIFKHNLKDEFQYFDDIKYTQDEKAKQVEKIQIEEQQNDSSASEGVGAKPLLDRAIKIYSLINILIIEKETDIKSKDQKNGEEESSKCICLPEISQNVTASKLTGYFKIFSLNIQSQEILVHKGTGKKLQELFKTLQNINIFQLLVKYQHFAKAIELQSQQVQLINKTFFKENIYKNIAIQGEMVLAQPDKILQKSDEQPQQDEQNEMEKQTFVYVEIQAKQQQKLQLSQYPEKIKDLQIIGYFSLVKELDLNMFKSLQMLKISQKDSDDQLNIKLVSEALLSIKNLETFYFKPYGIEISNEDSIDFTNSIISLRKLVNLKLILDSFGVQEQTLNCISAIIEDKLLKKKQQLQEKNEFDYDIMEREINNQDIKSETRSYQSQPSFISLSVQCGENVALEEQSIIPDDDDEQIVEQDKQQTIEPEEIKFDSTKQYAEFEIIVNNSSLRKEMQAQIANVITKQASDQYESTCLNFRGRTHEQTINSFSQNEQIRKFKFMSTNSSPLLFNNLQIQNCKNLIELRVSLFGLSEPDQNELLTQSIDSITKLEQLETLYFGTNLWGQAALSIILDGIKKIKKLKHFYLYVNYYDIDTAGIKKFKKFFKGMHQLETIYLMTYVFSPQNKYLQKLADVFKKYLGLKKLTLYFQRSGLTQEQYDKFIQIIRQSNSIQQFSSKIEFQEQFKVTNFKQHEIIKTYNIERFNELDQWFQNF